MLKQLDTLIAPVVVKSVVSSLITGMRNICYNINVWPAIALLAMTSVCSRICPAANPLPPSEVNDISPSPTAPGQTPSPPSLDVNDISFLWPVPQTKADVEALISLNDEAADGKIFPDELFTKLIDEAKTVSVGNSRISFPNEAAFKQPITWKVAGIRVNPSALGTHPLALIQGGVIPSIRLIVQPVTVTNGDAI